MAVYRRVGTSYGLVTVDDVRVAMCIEGLNDLVGVLHCNKHDVTLFYIKALQGGQP